MSDDAATAVVPHPAAWERPSPAASDDVAARRILDYVLLRATGVVLSVLVLGHFAVTHFITDVAHDDSAFVARRLSSGLWVAWDSTMLATALAHGTVGVRLALADYAAGRRRRALQSSVVLVSTLLFLLGAVAIAKAAHV